MPPVVGGDQHRRGPGNDDNRHHEGADAEDRNNNSFIMMMMTRHSRRSRIPWMKLLVVGFLGGFALFLQLTVWTLQHHVAQLQQRRQQQQQQQSSKQEHQQSHSIQSEESSSSSSSANAFPKTVKTSEAMDWVHIDSQHRRTKNMAAEAVWSLAVQEMDWDDPVVSFQISGDASGRTTTGSTDTTTTGLRLSITTSSVSSTISSSGGSSSSSAGGTMESSAAAASSEPNATRGAFYLEQAAKQGHAMAQFYLANTYASGVWPYVGVPTTLPSTSHTQATKSTSSNNREEDDTDTALPRLFSRTVQEHWNIPQVGGATGSVEERQMQQAMIYWHWSAMGGNTEAAVAMATRLGTTKSCSATLPYWSAAAHGVIDYHLRSPTSRGLVMPATDKHVLHEIHLHGGTGSQLDHDNRPDESPDALQYYHTRAADNKTDTAEAARLAFLLARYYRSGLRGVAQNVTLALQYYEQAAVSQHWEAAGKAGLMYFWGIGAKQDTIAAHKMFRIGTPGGFEGCQQRYMMRIKQKTADLSLCDSTCLTGMGLLHLLGVPLLAHVDTELATSYFKLAKDQDSADAAYYNAMTKLGWKTHFRPASSLSENGQTLLKDHYFPSDENNAIHHPTISEYQAILSDLVNAAGKGHVLAKHRLAMMYEHGVTIPNGGSTPTYVVNKDCDKAVKHYKAVVELGCPFRAQRMRKAYKQYTSGEVANALRNYLTCAESGSNIAMLNAAFLFEQGECLGLGKIDCVKASVRLWKAAAANGDSEASLRVGDFYYYGRFRENGKPPMGAWLEYVYFPENLLYQLALWVASVLGYPPSTLSEVSVTSAAQCLARDGSCPNIDLEQQHTTEKDLTSAAHYYRVATTRNDSPRAQFNLGFLYEWGLGLKQDFPLAKRHYDLAAAGSKKAELPVSIALLALSFHEFCVKCYATWKDWEAPPDSADYKLDGEVAANLSSHLPSIMSWESLLIVMLTIALWKFFESLQRRTQR